LGDAFADPAFAPEVPEGWTAKSGKAETDRIPKIRTTRMDHPACMDAPLI
jgi:hypothetical protein